MNGSENTTGMGAIVKALVMLAVLGLAVYLVRALGLDERLADHAWFADHVLGSGPVSVIIYVGVAVAATALGMPRQLVSFLGGYAFGALWGTALATLGTGLGCLLASGYARLFARDALKRRYGPRIQKVDAFLGREPFRMALIIRLFPLGSNLVTNLAAGVSSIPLLWFVLGSTVGYIPQNLVFALFGGGINAQSEFGMSISIGVSVVLLAASIWMGVALYRRYRTQAGGVVDE